MKIGNIKLDTIRHDGRLSGIYPIFKGITKQKVDIIDELIMN